jgi:DNA-binding beta-propeller fold protein YncE
MRQTKKILAGAALLSGLMMGAAFASTWHFKLVDKIALPCKPGHGDWVSYDPGNHDVYVSLHGSGMAVVDTKTNKVIHDFKNIPDPNTMTFNSHYIYETAAEGPGAGKVNQIVVINKKTWKVVDRVNSVGTTPDGVFIDKANNKLYVVSDDNNWIDVYTTGAHPKFIKKFTLYPPNPKSGPDVANLFNGTIYATDDAWVLMVNPNTGKIGTKVNYHVKLTKFGGTKDMFFDRAHNRLWVATTTGGVLIVNPKTLAVEKRLKESSKTGADAVAWDKKLGLVYVFEGGIPGFDVYSINGMKHVGVVKTGSKLPTHSGAVDPATHMIYAYAGGDAALYVYRPEK